MDDMVPHGIGDVAPWPDWPAAVDGALEFLAEHVGWDVWVVTRVQGDRQVVLRAYPSAAVPPGTELPWEDSFCRQMLSGNAPRLATVTAAVPAYASRSSGPLDGVAAYVGVPLVTEDVEVFGTLCGIAFRAKPRSAARDLPLVELVARMLSTLLFSFQEPASRPENSPPPASPRRGVPRIAS
jgi:GAF domain-containing protein